MDRQQNARNQILAGIEGLPENDRSQISSYLDVLARNAYVHGGIDADLEAGRFS